MASFSTLTLETQQQVFGYLDRQLLRSLRLISHDWCAALAHSIERKSYERSPEIAPIGIHFILNNHPVAICHYRDDLLPRKMTFDIWKAYFTGPNHDNRPFSKPALSKAVFHIQTPEDVTWKAHRGSFELESDEGAYLTVFDVLEGVSDCLWSKAFAVWEPDIVKWVGLVLVLYPSWTVLTVI